MSQSLIERDRACLWHPCTQHQLKTPVPIVGGKGAFLFTSDHKKILDGISSWWVTTHGHGHPYLNQALVKQLEQLEHVMFANFTHEPAITLAERLLKVAPSGLSKVFFSDNGATSVEVALKMAFQYWQHGGEQRNTFIALEHGYHGETFGAMATSAPSAFTKPFLPLLFKVHFCKSPRLFPNPEKYSQQELVEHCLKDLEQKLEQLQNQVAAVIIEPILQGSGGMILWPKGFLKGIGKLCKKYETLLIADEILTGFGRTGTLFACEHESVSPDIMCLAKGLNAGYLPLAATLVSEQIFQAFLSHDIKKTFFHSHSMIANPLGCAVANASLDLFEQEQTLQKIGTMNQILSAQLENLKDVPIVAHTRHIGPLAVMELHDDEQGYYSQGAQNICRMLFEQGLFLRPLGNVLYFMPPYCTSEEDLVRCMELIKRTLEMS